jgi:hypothetical protein
MTSGPMLSAGIKAIFRRFVITPVLRSRFTII